ncbi:hypothetical protein BGZ82_004622, partial [Podila clonocystis]
MLLITKTMCSNYLPRVFGMFLYSNGTPRKVIDVLSNAGLSVSYSSIMGSLVALTNSSLASVREFVQRPFTFFYILYDNINIAFRKTDQRLGNQDDFQNGAAGTIIALKYKAEPNIQGNCRHVTLSDLYPTKANGVQRKRAAKYHLVE